ncbi:MAG TPA: FAD-dependent oxidoreductase [Wenzhouxiangellaceae bacterium]|nr:FAD-dependent oxidoreductase [Wenzhouxiangellaceae bacterium]
MQRITIVGAGFGGLNTVQALRKTDRHVGIDLVAPRPAFVFYPGTIWIPTERRRPDRHEIPLGTFFERMNVDYHEASATGLSDDGRRLETTAGPIDNDGLIIASGSCPIDRPEGLEHAFVPCNGIDEMARLRERLHAIDKGTLAFGFTGNPDEASAIRGGPVFELLFGIETWLRRSGRRGDFRLVFFSSSQRPGRRLGDKAADRLIAEMNKRGIDTRLGVTPTRFETNRVVAENDGSENEFDSDLTVFMPGLTGAAWFDRTKLPRSTGRLLAADRYCRVSNSRRIYVVGDAGSHAGPAWLPKRGHTAENQAAAAARNLLDELAGRAPSKPFRAEMVYIVDMLDKAMLIVRSEKMTIASPPLRPLHWLKRAFEWNYKRRFQ